MDSVLDSLYGPGKDGSGDGNVSGSWSQPTVGEAAGAYGGMSRKAMEKQIKVLEREMREAAKALEFEQAAQARDAIAGLRQRLLDMG